MNAFTEQKQTHRHRKQTYGYQSRSVGAINQEFGTNIYILLYIYTHTHTINNKDLLYSIGNYIQYFVITYNGK